MQNVAFLLEGEEAVLEKALTEKTVDTRKEQVIVPLSVEKVSIAAVCQDNFYLIVYAVTLRTKVYKPGISFQSDCKSEIMLPK